MHEISAPPVGLWDRLGWNAQLAHDERSKLPHHQELRSRLGETDSGQLRGGQVGSDLRLFAPTELIVDLGGDLTGDEAVGPKAIGLLIKRDVAPTTGATAIRLTTSLAVLPWRST
jgi:hypothetical protein